MHKLFMRISKGKLLDRLGVFVLLLALGGLFGVANAQNVSDVPPSHWAYEAVKDLVSRGYLALDDGLFQGDKPVDRFLLATTVARILHEIESGAIAPQSQADVELLRRVVNEYREDLVEAFARIEQAEAAINKTNKDLAATDETISRVMDRIGLVYDELQKHGDEVERNHSQLSARLYEEVEQLRALLNEMTASVNERTASVRAETATDQAAMRQEITDLIHSLRQDQGQALAEATDQLREDIRQLRSTADVALSEIQSQLNAHAESLAAQQLTLEQQRLALDETDQELVETIASVESALGQLQQDLRQMRSDVDAMAELTRSINELQTRLDRIERQTLAMQSQIGLSEEQLSALSQRLMTELESQYQHSFLLAGNVGNELNSLREEYTRYRQRTEADLSRAKQAQTFGIIGAVLGLIAIIN